MVFLVFYGERLAGGPASGEKEKKQFKPIFRGGGASFRCLFPLVFDDGFSLCAKCVHPICANQRDNLHQAQFKAKRALPLPYAFYFHTNYTNPSPTGPIV